MVLAPAVRMRGIDKRFGAVQANRAVDLTVASGSVHGIVGENGAGKSTLMAILYGFHAADAGTIEVDGRPASIADAGDAMALGIGMVHQHFMLVDTLSALDNVMLGAEPGWRLGPARLRVRRELQTLMNDTGLAVRLDAAVEDLPVGGFDSVDVFEWLILLAGDGVVHLGLISKYFAGGVGSAFSEVHRRAEAIDPNVDILLFEVVVPGDN